MKVFVGLGLSFALSAAAYAAEPGTHVDISGVWWSKQKVTAIRPVGGGAIPFTAAGAAEYAKNKPVVRAMLGKLPGLGNMKRCIPPPPPNIWGSGFPFQIFQEPDVVTIAYEFDHMRRFVYMNEKVNPETADPGYVGNSVGHWDGDTLVIDSSVFKPDTYLDDTGLPHTEKLKVTERVRKVDAKTLEVLATVDDPEMYSKPWTARYTFTLYPDERIQQYICGVDAIKSRFGTTGKMPTFKHLGS
ncbi:MAG TPA: hypothetical protein VL358_14145 [Caulobacteraceae bacterium]|jgi:hypothetical protein|nr:hypothetical protein [Caulobacteraceae bacterium]